MTEIRRSPNYAATVAGLVPAILLTATAVPASPNLLYRREFGTVAVSDSAQEMQAIQRRVNYVYGQLHAFESIRPMENAWADLPDDYVYPSTWTARAVALQMVENSPPAYDLDDFETWSDLG